MNTGNMVISGVPRGIGGFTPLGGSLSPRKFISFDKAEPNSQFRGKYISYNLIRIRVSPICKLSGPLVWGLPPPDPRSICPLSSTDFVEPPLPEKIPEYATDGDMLEELTHSVQDGAAVKLHTWILKALHGCSKKVQINAGIIPPLCHDRILSNPFHFIVHHHPTIQFYKAWVAR
jgi:hypothetical protein